MTDPRNVPGQDQSSPDEEFRLRDPEVATSDPRERAELNAVASLLRGLPDPEPPEDLVARVLGRVAEREARPSVIRGVFRKLAEPRVAAALAAGISCLLLVTALQDGSLEPLFRSGDAPAIAQAPTTNPAFARGPTLRVARPRAVAHPTIATPQFVSMLSAYSGSDVPPAPPRFQAGQQPTAKLLERRLDHQLNQLLLDPAAFCERLERVMHRNRFVARLADRAAQRGDATEVALGVRATHHPLAQQLVDRFLRASLVKRISDR